MATEVSHLPAAPTPSPTAHGHGRAWQSFEKIGAPVNKLLNRVGSEAFWPTSLEQESEKAGRILKAFCKDGIYTSLPQEKVESKHESKSEKKSKSDKKSKSKHDKHNSKQSEHEYTSEKLPEYSPEASHTPTTSPKPPKALIKIPASVIQNALGLAIFTVARAGTWGASLACGSGVLIARKQDNTWSSPSGIIVNTLGLGFLTGIDVYDCVVVINTPAALDKFRSTRVSLGGEVSVTAGPWGAGGNVDVGIGKGPIQPVFTYIKSRGLYAGVQMDGTVIGVRGDENARFYGERVAVEDVLSGRVYRWNALEEVVGEVERGAVETGLDANLREAPVLMEFIDRRGEKKGKDGVWRKDGVVADEERDVGFRDAPSIIGEKEERYYDADEKMAPVVKKDDEEWEDERRFNDLDDKNAPSVKVVANQDDGEWEDERRFYDMDEKKGAYEKTDRYS